MTSEMTDEDRLLELLVDGATTSDEVVPPVATEPILIAAPMTHQPVAWAFTARIWTDDVQHPKDRPWGILAKAIHGHGVSTITGAGAGIVATNPGETPGKGHSPRPVRPTPTKKGLVAFRRSRQRGFSVLSGSCGRRRTLRPVFLRRRW